MNVGRGTVDNLRRRRTTHNGLRAKEPTQNAGNVTHGNATPLSHLIRLPDMNQACILICVQRPGNF